MRPGDLVQYTQPSDVIPKGWTTLDPEECKEVWFSPRDVRIGILMEGPMYLGTHAFTRVFFPRGPLWVIHEEIKVIS